MPNYYLKNHDQLINKIINSNKDYSKNKLLNSFIEHFYSHVSLEKILPKDFIHLNNIAEQTLEFCKIRELNRPKIRYYSKNQNILPTFKTNVIEIINDDMPFLVDSISEEIARQGLKIHKIIHPIIPILRDDKGQITEIGDKQREKNIPYESLIHIQLKFNPNEALISKLLQRLEDILKCVRLSTHDWSPMLQEASNSINDMKDDGHNQEEIELLKWIQNGNFTFIGYAAFNQTKSEQKLECEIKSNLGILKNDTDDTLEIVLNSILNLNNRTIGRSMEIGKINKISPIHRNTNIDYVLIPYFKNNKLIKVNLFIGLFTSRLLYQSTSLIPVIRQKVNEVITRSKFKPVSYNGKELITIIEALPKTELFQLSEDELFELTINIFSLLIQPNIKLFVRQDNTKAFINCMVFIPKENFSNEISEKIQEILSIEFQGIASISQALLGDQQLAYFYVVITFSELDINKVNIQKIEKNLLKEIRSWKDNFYTNLLEKFGEDLGDKYYKNYKNSFPVSYRHTFSENTAIQDLVFIEEALSSNEVLFDICEMENNNFQLKIYSPQEKIMLSAIMSILENLILNVVDEHTYLITTDKGKTDIWLHCFQLVPSHLQCSFLEIKENIQDTLRLVWNKKVQNDQFNKLVISACLNWRQVVLIRALSKYIHQIGFLYNQEYITEVLLKYPYMVKLLVDLFYTSFNPNFDGKRDNKIKELQNEIDIKIKEVTNIAEDKVIRQFIYTIKATLRTNYFQKDIDGNHKDYISFKLNSENIPNLPLPKPFAEIFVYSPTMEGIHLRFGKVARGGLRWSDRIEDFRTEVLGLVKAQRVKNSVIVPVGSKGGFIFKNSQELSREEYLKEGVNCYKTFLKGLLDVTDNIVKGDIVKPQSVICYDEDDPYLVVAADKGTATFSDTANQISKEYNFWLSDAFASGGSAGYDHKKMGITARGAWVCVRRHFSEMGINIDKEEFTAVGIGDMSGDVFGNGMLLSNNLKLLGAFNHIHIFVDPNPDSKVSYQERKRLFGIARSTWLDYDKSKLSAGGAVFERKAKSIKLTKEIMARFKINKEEISPDELIKVLLTAEVNLLWNGGIGTYVKSEAETHLQVGDKTNDNLRVNGKDLNCLIVGEGGNLGFTQLGRIEYALKGGVINTDAIDNSAGVDCSDHEVNIKIALSAATKSGKLDGDKRNKLLSDMTDEVAKLVLKDNFLQSQTISIIASQGPESAEMQSRLAQTLENKGILNRKVEFLPSEEEFIKRITVKQGLTRPEIAVLLAYSKLAVYDDLLDSNLPNEAYCQKFLIDYFPKTMQKEFKAEILEHPLKKEIITTVITNELVNRLGNCFFHATLEDTGLKGCDIARAYIVVKDILELDNLWHEIEQLDNKTNSTIQISLHNQVIKLIQKSILWLLSNLPQPLDVDAVILRFKEGINKLTEKIDDFIIGQNKSEYQEKIQNLKELGLSEDLAVKITHLSPLLSAWGIVFVATENKVSLSDVASIYFTIGTKFDYDWLISTMENLQIDSYWHRLSIQAIRDDLYDQQRKLTDNVIKHCSTSNNPIEEWCKLNNKLATRVLTFMQDLKTQKNIDYSMLVVAEKRLSTLIEFC